MSAALIVFAKAPVPGRVKTRLTPPLAPEDAAALYAAFLHDSLDAYTAPDAFGEAVAVRLYLAGNEEAPNVARPGLSVHRQRGEGLGARMQRSFVETFAAGFGRAVIVGTDHPTLPLAFLDEAFRALREPLTAVIGPSDDGGYYALGLNDLVPGLFDMAYSHGDVFEATLDRVVASRVQAVVLPAWYDVDDADALGRLADEWRAGAALPRRTERVLQRLLERHPDVL